MLCIAAMPSRRGFAKLTTDDGADSEQNQQWVFTCPAEGDCGNQV